MQPVQNGGSGGSLITVHLCPGQDDAFSGAQRKAGNRTTLIRSTYLRQRNTRLFRYLVNDRRNILCCQMDFVQRRPVHFIKFCRYLSNWQMRVCGHGTSLFVGELKHLTRGQIDSEIAII